MSNEQTNKSRPTHRIYSVTKEGEKTRWTELGAAWPHKDGKGFNLKYTACPVGECDIVLRKIEPKVNAEAPKSRVKTANRKREFVAASSEAGAQ